MRDYFQPTIKRYLRRWRPTQRPATIHSKSSILRRFVAYLREHHPEVHRFSQLQRDPHIEGWLESMLHLSPVTRKGGMHLTPVPTTCCGRGYGRISTYT